MKSLAKIAGILFVLIVAVLVGALFYVDSIAKKAIEYGGSEALGVPTTLSEISISLFGGKASFKGLQVANPSGFKADKFLGLGAGDVAVSLGSLTGATIVVPKVRLADIEVNLEQAGKQSNLDPILAKAKASSSSSSSSASTASGESSGKKLIVDLFVIEGVNVNARLAALGESTNVHLKLPRIELRDLGADKGGMPVQELVQKVVQAILDVAANSSAELSPALATFLNNHLQGLGDIKTEVFGKASAEVEKLSGEMGKVLDQVPGDGTGVVKEQTDQLLKGVKGLMGGKK